MTTVDTDELPGLADAAATVYAVSPDEFVATRTAAVKAARAAGDRPLATAIGALRRPTRSAWLVNLLAREAPEDLAGLLDIGEALREAQQQLAADDLRRLSRDRHRAVESLVRRAVELAESHDYTAPEAARQEVGQTLQAALADAEVSRQVQAGVITQAVAYGGFGPSDLAVAVPTRPPAKPRPAKTKASLSVVGPDDTRLQAIAEAQQKSEDAAAAAERAEEARREAAEAADRATADADRLADEVDEARTRLAELENTARQAQRDARVARKESDSQTSAAARARSAADDAAAAWEKLRSS